MKSLSYILLFLCLIALFSNCKRDRTTWYPEYAVPIAHGQLSVFDIQNDEYLSLDEDVIRVHFYDTLKPLDLAEVVNLGDTILEAAYTTGFSFGPIPIENGNSIFTLAEDFTFNLDDAELRSGKIKSGLLRVVFESDVDGYLDLNYMLPGIVLDSEVLSISSQTTPASAEDPYTEEFFIDVSGYALDFTGLDGNDRNTLYGELSVFTSEAPGYIAQVYGTDEIRVKLELLEIEVEELRGYFGQWHRDINELITLDSVFYQGGDISLSEIDVSLEFINNFGIDAQFQISDLSAVNSISAEELTLTTNGLYEQFNVPRAIEMPNGVIPNSFEFNFDETSNLAEVISITPNQFRLQADAILNPLGDISGGFDFYLDRYPFQMVTDVQFPLCVGINNLVLADTLSIGLENIEDIKNIKFLVNIENDFPVGFEFNIILENELEPLLSGEVLAGLDSGNSVVHQMEINLSQEELERFVNASYINITATANTIAGEEAKFLTTQKIDIFITAEVTYEASL